MIKFTAEGSKEVFRAKEITKKTFEFWKDKPDELSEHVNGGSADEDVEIGIYDEIEDFTVTTMVTSSLAAGVALPIPTL